MAIHALYCAGKPTRKNIMKPIQDNELNAIHYRIQHLKSRIIAERRPASGLILVDGHEKSAFGPGSVCRAANGPAQVRGRINTSWVIKGLCPALIIDFSTSQGNVHAGFEGIVRVDGRDLQGLDQRRSLVWLDGIRRGNHRLEVEFRADWTGSPHIMEEVVLAALDMRIRDLYWDLNTALESLQLVDGASLRQGIQELVKEAIFSLNLTDADSHALGMRCMKARKRFQSGLAKLGGPADFAIHAVGNAHLDVAWLWDLNRTGFKARKTFLNVMSLMYRYPKWIFLQAQPHHYALIREQDPSLFRRIKSLVRTGRWEPEGAMWTMADMNLPSGESLARQFILGKRFFHDVMNRDSKVNWQPDSFGYSAQIPQLMRLAGVPYFVGRRITANDTTRFPYDTFRWRGLDGSEVLAHILCGSRYESRESSYELDVEPGLVVRAACNHREKTQELIYAYGMGDGGGGPRPEDLEVLNRLDSFPGMPRVLPCGSLAAMRSLERKRNILPIWDGEIYLQQFRGGYTTHSVIKRLLRRLEIRLVQAEAMEVLAGHDGKRKWDEWWKILARYQSHDVICGTCVRKVYEQTRPILENTIQEVRGTLDTARCRVTGYKTRGSAVRNWMCVFNPLPWDRNDPVEVSIQGRGSVIVQSADGQDLPTQDLGTHQGVRRILFSPDRVPAMGWTFFQIIKGRKTANKGVFATSKRLRGEGMDIRLDRRGRIVRLVGKDGIVFTRGCFNELQCFGDLPPHTENALWLDWLYREDRLEDPKLVRSVVMESGPVRGALRLEYRFRNSRIIQTIRLAMKTGRVDFNTRMDWHDRHVLVKAAFHTPFNAREFTCEIPFGNVRRPAQRRFLKGQAMFEVPARRWADITRKGTGLALLNNGCHGIDANDGVLSLSLLRSTSYPDPEADKGLSTFTYAMVPHAGTWKEARIQRMAAELNEPMEAMPAFGPGKAVDGIRVPPGVAVAACKPGLDAGDPVLRVYDYHGRSRNVKLDLPRWCRRLASCDLLERTSGNHVHVQHGRARFPLGAYQIRSFLMKRE